MDNLGDILSTNHQVTLNNLHDLDQDMGTLLERYDTMRYNNCHDLVININSKINRIIFLRCHNITLKVAGLISGLDIKHSDSITIINKARERIGTVIVESSSDILLKLSRSTHEGIVYEIDKCKNINIQDLNNKKLHIKNS